MSNGKVTICKFKNHVIRGVIGKDGKPWFAISDLYRVLELKDPEAIPKLPDKACNMHISHILGRIKNIHVTNELGLYCLAVCSGSAQATALMLWADTKFFSPNFYSHREPPPLEGDAELPYVSGTAALKALKQFTK